MKVNYFTVLLALAALLFAGCSGYDSKRDATSVGQDGWVFEGWACAPDTEQALKGKSPAEYCGASDKKDYLYMKFSAVAEQSTIDSGRIAAMQATCRRAARDLVAGEGLSKVLGDYIEQVSGVKNGQSTGHMVLAESKGQVAGVGLYNCCSIDNATGRCVKSGEAETWEQCQCVGYMKFTGGEKAFSSKVEKAIRESN